MTEWTDDIHFQKFVTVDVFDWFLWNVFFGNVFDDASMKPSINLVHRDDWYVTNIIKIGRTDIVNEWPLLSFPSPVKMFVGIIFTRRSLSKQGF